MTYGGGRKQCQFNLRGSYMKYFIGDDFYLDDVIALRLSSQGCDPPGQ